MTRDGSGSAKPDREHRAERDRYLAEDVSGLSLTDDALDSVYELDRLDATLEQAEERTLATLGVRRTRPARSLMSAASPGETLALFAVEAGEDRDPRDLFGGHHEPQRYSSVGARERSVRDA